MNLRNITPSEMSVIQKVTYRFHLHEVLAQTKLIYGGRKSDQLLPMRVVEEKADWGDAQENLLGGWSCFITRGDCVYICQNSLNGTLEMCAFYHL